MRRPPPFRRASVTERAPPAYGGRAAAYTRAMDAGRIGSSAALVLALLAAPAAAAQALYKCEDADGAIAFQDRPCPPHSRQLPPPLLAPETRGLSPARDSYALPAQAAAPAAATAPDPVAVPRLPAMYRCHSAEGASYVSNNPTPRGRYIPLWALGSWPSIEGPVGASPPRPTRPGTATPPPRPGSPTVPVPRDSAPAPAAPAGATARPRGGWPATMAAGYTWVQDQCFPMGRAELCAWWESEYDRIGGRRRIAFQDERPALDGQYRDLRTNLDTYCR